MEKPQPPPPPPPPSLLRHLITIDTTISTALHNLTQPFLPRSFLKLLEISGDGRLFFPLILSLLLSASASPILINLLIGGLLDLLIIGLIKHLVRRPRPIYNKNMFLTFSVDHWSFPSGHSSRVCFIAAMLYLSKDSIDESVGRFNLVVVVWAAVTSVSRVLLGRHYVFDVAAGAGIGVVNAVFVFRFLNCEFFKSILFPRRLDL